MITLEEAYANIWLSISEGELEVTVNLPPENARKLEQTLTKKVEDNTTKKLKVLNNIAKIIAGGREIPNSLLGKLNDLAENIHQDKHILLQIEAQVYFNITGEMLPLEEVSN